MLKILRKLNEGSLLQRTMMHIAVFVAGSASVVGLTSVLLVSTAKAVLPPHDATEAGADSADAEDEKGEKGADAEPGSPEAAARPAGARAGSKALARVANRREGAVAQ
ncbi:hypothetical protein [Sorangium cellulosum]|uniref:Uncharacterized protein n=2 Tax=Sorangium cellulosum TaxID=56 RepID=A0A150TL25_SORCE|nr:hypothetical protein [Sorangium cellulosum]AGP36005.1 hypothetical protein SCE1572_16735 [Sorangium cellulosum So0157-2]KYG05413.1 hypothetical protein BE21_40805 [Sorangium cellulosum]